MIIEFISIQIYKQLLHMLLHVSPQVDFAHGALRVLTKGRSHRKYDIELRG